MPEKEVVEKAKELAPPGGAAEPTVRCGASRRFHTQAPSPHAIGLRAKG